MHILSQACGVLCWSSFYISPFKPQPFPALFSVIKLSATAPIKFLSCYYFYIIIHFRKSFYYYLIKIHYSLYNAQKWVLCSYIKLLILHLQKLFITFKSFDTAMVSNQPTFIKNKTNQQRAGLHHTCTALQYLTEIADNHNIQIHGSKNISSQLHNLRRFTNVLKYELHRCGSKQLIDVGGGQETSQVLINVGLKVRKYMLINHENGIDAIVSNSKTRAT